jgi:O-methyltransferase
MIASVSSLLLRPVFEFLLKPNIRYRYLPKLHELITYSRKEEMLHTCLEYVSLAEIQGDYLEFGVWKGRSLISAYHLSRRFDGLSQMRFFGFDSFKGIPPLTENGFESEEFPPGTFRASIEETTRYLEEAKVDIARVSLVEGWYSDVLNAATRRNLSLKAAAVVYVDCNVYESAALVLDFIEPHLVDGSVIIFDDWYCFKNNSDRGEQKAFTEWLARNPHIQATPYKEFGWDGKSFLINHLPLKAVHASDPHQAADEMLSAER